MSVCAFKKGGKCVPLTRDNCTGCTFFKTNKELEEGRLKAKERFESLPDDVQARILDKYYQKPLKTGGDRR